MGKYKRYLYEDVKIPRCTLLKRKRRALHPCYNIRNRALYQPPLEEGVPDVPYIPDETEVSAGTSGHVSSPRTNNEDSEDLLRIDTASDIISNETNASSESVTGSDSERGNNVSDDENVDSSDSESVSNGSDNEGGVSSDAVSIGEDAFDGDDTVMAIIPNEDKICPCAKVGANDVVIMTLAAGLRHNLSWAAQVDFLKLINTMYGDDKVPSSKYLFLKQIENRNTKINYHFICPNDKCARYLGEKSAIEENVVHCDCGESVNVTQAQNFFISLSLEDQLRELLKDKNVVQSLFSHRFNRVKIHPDNIEDIYDGKEYKKYFAEGILSNPHNFSYSFNTDGMPIGKSSKKTLWPIYVTINELPHEDRDKYVLLAGLYIGKKDPDQTMFLEPFVDQANYLSSTGFTWEYEGSLINSLVIPLCAVVDSVARFQMLNMSSYVSYYGCTFCYNKSEKTRRGIRFTLNKEKCQQRTSESTRGDVREAYERRHETTDKKRRYRGVKGPSPLMWLTYFNLIAGFVPDYMHAVLQGIVRLHTELLFESTNKKFWIGMNDRIAMDHIINALDVRLLSIHPPNVVTRLPRSLHERALWKASEWRAWLIFYCVPCLQGILKGKYVDHLALLSTAMYMLLQDSISKDSLRQIELLLLRYVFLFEKYFEKESMVYNVHLLTHLVNGVRNWGPLWTHNCFLYEGKNRHILQMYQSPNQVLKQLVRKFLTFGALPSLIVKFGATDKAVEFCESLLSKKLKVFLTVGEVTLIGRQHWHHLSAEEQRTFSRFGNLDVNNIEFYEAMLYKRCRLTTDKYAKEKKNDNSFVYLKENQYGQIVKIIRDSMQNKVYVMLKILKISRNPVTLNDPEVTGMSTQFFKVKDSMNLITTSPRNIIDVCVCMDTPSGVYICTVPYGSRSDL